MVSKVLFANVIAGKRTSPLAKYSPEERKRPMYYKSGNSTIVIAGPSVPGTLSVLIWVPDLF